MGETNGASGDAHRIDFKYFSQEDLLKAGCLDFRMAIDAAEAGMMAHRRGEVIFPDKIVQIFNQQTQERINCLPATLKLERVCGVKWVSVFPPNVDRFGLQNLTAVFVLSEIEKGFPVAVMEGTLASNMRVGAMGAIAAKHLAPPEPRAIGFIGSGEQAKMHLLAMKTVLPSLSECRVSAKTTEEEEQFIEQMAPILPEMKFVSAQMRGEVAIQEADVVVTATSAQAPLLKAAWMKPGSFYSHIGGWEDEYAVAQQCEKIVCDDWETVKHRTQTLSRMYKEGLLADDDVYGNLDELVAGEKPGREKADERAYFNAVGLAFVDVAIAWAMYQRAAERNVGQPLTLQETTIFEHAQIGEWFRR
ncbi:MAG: ornithine cyclodeaminase family protein [Planctomycetota bacterium]|jgi:ornithine cyclodeaminase/alanine dehydrogenase-like protein (mu-crystallin family)